MVETQEKVTVLNASATTDGGQPHSQNIKDSIPERPAKINDDFESEYLREYFRQVNNPDYLHTVSLTELYDTVYQPKASVIDGLLCSGAYLFVGAPKVGKSFFMAQLGYHVNGVFPCGSTPFTKALSSILRWRMTMLGCKSDCRGCSAWTVSMICISPPMLKM